MLRFFGLIKPYKGQSGSVDDSLISLNYKRLTQRLLPLNPLIVCAGFKLTTSTSLNATESVIWVGGGAVSVRF